MKKLIVALLLAVLSFSLLAFAACGGDGEEEKKDPATGPAVSKIEVSVKPDKDRYVVGETFSLAGGKIKVTYDDGTSTELAMDAEGVEVSSPNMGSEGTKTVTVTYGGKQVRFTISVVSASYTVTFDYNYEGAPEPVTQSVVSGDKATDPGAERSGYELYAWYLDKDYTVRFDFNEGITANTTLYAFWKKDGATYVDFTFDYDYYGKKLTEYTIPAEVGVPMTKPSDPSRDGYEFAGWYTDDTFTTEFDFTANVIEADTAVAKWTKTDIDLSTFTFEAEDTDLTGKVGPSYSGTASEKSMVQFEEGLNASGNRWVGYQYQRDLSLEFEFASDVAVSDAKISVSFSTELGTQTFSPENYTIMLNNEPLDYNDITIVSTGDEKAQFRLFVVAENAAIKEGANIIQLVTTNDIATQGTTFKSIAPLVDCVQIETTAILYWDETKGLPAANY